MLLDTGAQMDVAVSKDCVFSVISIRHPTFPFCTGLESDKKWYQENNDRNHFGNLKVEHDYEI
jgi:hypothetical protein